MAFKHIQRWNLNTRCASACSPAHPGWLSAAAASALSCPGGAFELQPLAWGVGDKGEQI